MTYDDYKHLVAKWGQQRTDASFARSIAAMLRTINKIERQ